jgi:hypothetical protein
MKNLVLIFTILLSALLLTPSSAQAGNSHRSRGYHSHSHKHVKIHRDRCHHRCVIIRGHHVHYKYCPPVRRHRGYRH